MWEGDNLRGPPRGRFFEQLLLTLCDDLDATVSEGPGSCTLTGVASASGLRHENDVVISAGYATVHIEAKHLGGAVSKNDLLIFNQKGLDFLLADDPSVRRIPLYRLFVSGSPLSPTARRFATLWGIIIVEPDRLPLPLLHWLAGSTFEFPADLREWQERIWREIPAFVVPLQERLIRAASCIADETEMIASSRIDVVIDEQFDLGGQVWGELDSNDPAWLERCYIPKRAA
jgi:hypothetical protein